jgi:hypothetical protein
MLLAGEHGEYCLCDVSADRYKKVAPQLFEERTRCWSRRGLHSELEVIVGISNT